MLPKEALFVMIVWAHDSGPRTDWEGLKGQLLECLARTASSHYFLSSSSHPVQSVYLHRRARRIPTFVLPLPATFLPPRTSQRDPKTR